MIARYSAGAWAFSNRASSKSRADPASTKPALTVTGMRPGADSAPSNPSALHQWARPRSMPRPASSRPSTPNSSTAVESRPESATRGGKRPSSNRPALERRNSARPAQNTRAAVLALTARKTPGMAPDSTPLPSGNCAYQRHASITMLAHRTTVSDSSLVAAMKNSRERNSTGSGEAE